jgi:hypothetical protein
MGSGSGKAGREGATERNGSNGDKCRHYHCNATGKDKRSLRADTDPATTGPNEWPVAVDLELVSIHTRPSLNILVIARPTGVFF